MLYSNDGTTMAVCDLCGVQADWSEAVMHGWSLDADDMVRDYHDQTPTTTFDLCDAHARLRATVDGDGILKPGVTDDEVRDHWEAFRMFVSRNCNPWASCGVPSLVRLARLYRLLERWAQVCERAGVGLQDMFVPFASSLEATRRAAADRIATDDRLGLPEEERARAEVVGRMADASALLDALAGSPRSWPRTVIPRADMEFPCKKPFGWTECLIDDGCAMSARRAS